MELLLKCWEKENELLFLSWMSYCIVSEALSPAQSACAVREGSRAGGVWVPTGGLGSLLALDAGISAQLEKERKARSRILQCVSHGRRATAGAEKVYSASNMLTYLAVTFPPVRQE